MNERLALDQGHAGLRRHIVARAGPGEGPESTLSGRSFPLRSVACLTKPFTIDTESCKRDELARPDALGRPSSALSVSYLTCTR